MAEGIDQFADTPLSMSAQVSGNLADSVNVDGVQSAGSLPKKQGLEAALENRYGGPSANEIGRAVVYALMQAGAIG